MSPSNGFDNDREEDFEDNDFEEDTFDPEKNQLSEQARLILERASHFEVLSLDPNAGARDQGSPGTFHGWPILGRTLVKDLATRNRHFAALNKGLAENQGEIADCFDPRHAIHAIHEGEAVDVVISFECNQVEVHVGTGVKHLLTRPSPEPTFDRVLEDASVPLAAKAR